MSTKENVSKHIQTLLNVLQAEIDGDMTKALNLVGKNYSMTWMYRGQDRKAFPKDRQRHQARNE